MKKKHLIISVVVMFILILYSCIVFAPNLFENNETKPVGNIIESSLTVEEITKEYLPHPFSPVLHTDSLEYKGKWAGSIMPEFTREMKNLGWEQYDVMGAKVFYKKEIKGQEIKISIRPKEQGGPEEKNATTFVIVEYMLVDSYTSG